MRRISLISLPLLFALSCSNDAAPTTSTDAGEDSSTMEKDVSKDGYAKADMTTSDLPKVELDMGDQGVADMSDTSGDFPPQACLFPSTDVNCPQGPYGPGTFFTKVEILPDDSCCFDFTKDGNFDNEIGSILSLLGGFGINANQNIATAIQSGELVYLLEYTNWENEVQDSNLAINLYFGSDAAPDFSDNLAGSGNFLVDPTSINQATQKPKWGFKKVKVKGGNLHASEGTLRLSFPGLLDAVRMEIVDARITAKVDPSADLSSGGRVILSEGKLSGAFLRAEFFASLNEATTICACTNAPLFTPKGDGNYACNITPEQEAACKVSPVQGCRFLGNPTVCTVLGSLGSRTDVDTDNDQVTDAFSFGALIEGTGAKIVDL